MSRLIEHCDGVVRNAGANIRLPDTQLDLLPGDVKRHDSKAQGRTHHLLRWVRPNLHLPVISAPIYEGH